MVEGAGYFGMLRKHPRSEMHKASIWMTKKEFAKLAKLSGDKSLNLFIMQAVRKEIGAAAAAEEEKEEELQKKT